MTALIRPAGEPADDAPRPHARPARLLAVSWTRSPFPGPDWVDYQRYRINPGHPAAQQLLYSPNANTALAALSRFLGERDGRSATPSRSRVYADRSAGS